MPTIRVGTLDRRQVWVTAEIEGNRLSMTGEVVARPGVEPVECGQIIEAVRECKPANGWTHAELNKLADVWARWHLNDMRAGCEHQRAEGWNKRPIDPSRPTDTYGTHFEGQRQASWNMLAWVRPEDHPDGLLTRPCPVCGYRYGTAWLTEELPQEIRDYVESLAARA
jgi:hypothetical protein